MKTQDQVITRTFDAPRERIWQAWTNPERLMRCMSEMCEAGWSESFDKLADSLN